MGVYDFEKVNGFIRQGLDVLLFEDLWSLYIFNESDMHSAAYYYIRKFMEKKGRDDAYVRCEPMILGSKPDIVIYKNSDPLYIIELKMFSRPDQLDERGVLMDLAKMADIMEKTPSIRWGFFLMIYDHEEPFNPSPYTMRKSGFDRLSITSINARRHEKTDRLRSGYKEWRQDFDKITVAHKF
jgi:hypothetical protein